MIFDLISNRSLYQGLSPRLSLGLDWLSRFEKTTPDGRIELDGDRVFALVQSYETAPAAEKKFETHRDHIDIQFVAAGAEAMLCAPVGGLRVTTPYDPAKDAAFYSDPAAYTSIHCEPGSFTIFFPHDGHKGGCTSLRPSRVKKVVIKVRV